MSRCYRHACRAHAERRASPRRPSGHPRGPRRPVRLGPSLASAAATACAGARSRAGGRAALRSQPQCREGGRAAAESQAGRMRPTASKTCPAGRRTKRCATLVFPTPASPPTNTRRPLPARASSYAVRSCASSSSRSSRVVSEHPRRDRHPRMVRRWPEGGNRLERRADEAQNMSVTTLLERDELLDVLDSAGKAAEGGSCSSAARPGSARPPSCARSRTAQGVRVLRGSCENLRDADAARPVRRPRREAGGDLLPCIAGGRDPRCRARGPDGAERVRQCSCSKTCTGPTRRHLDRCACSAAGSTARRAS